MEKILRSGIQRHERISYIFSGSEASLMYAMFNHTRRAFYKTGRLIVLGQIPREEYLDFIEGWFMKGGYKASGEDLLKVFDLGSDGPYNV